MSVYVVRTSPNIEADLARGWSAWQDGGCDFMPTSFTQAQADDVFNLLADPRFVKQAQNDQIAASYFDFYDSEAIEIARCLAQDEHEVVWNIKVGFVVGFGQYERGGRWYNIHHHGLSCYLLGNGEFEDDQAAIAYASSQNRELHGDFTDGGYVTCGQVRLVAQLATCEYLLVCEEVTKEKV